MRTILLVDDDRVFRTMLRHWFVEHGWNVLEADDGEVGVQMAKECAPDVIVCDLLMPRCNGFQLCRELKAESEVFSKTKIIITTGSGYETNRLNALEAGADYFMTKPLMPSDILKVIEQTEDPAPATKSSPQTDRLKRAEFSSGNHLKFWGVRGSIPTPGSGTVFYGGNTSCVEVRADDELIILDAGTGIRPLGVFLAAEFKDRSIPLTLIVSHTHWDHIQGFPFFAPAYNPNNDIHVLAYDGAQEGLQATLSSQMESPYFPITMAQMPSSIVFQGLKDLEFSVGKVNIEAAFMNHPGICMGYRLTTSTGSMAYIPDNELFERQKSESGNGPAVDPRAVHDFAKKQDQNLVEFIRDVDILIMDSQYKSDEYPLYVGWGHSCVDDTVRLAVKAGVKRLYLFHHDPTHDDGQINEMVSSARELVASLGGKTKINAAREGDVVEIKSYR